MKGPTNSSARPNIRLLNVSATFESNPDTSNNTEFPYRASIQADGVSEYMSATVMFSQIQATSGNFATYSQTGDGVIYVYSKTDVGTITIPAVSCDLSVNYINVDNIPTEDSQAVITSGGVYDAIGTKGSDTKPLKSVDGVLTPVNDALAKASDIPTKVISDYAQRVTYWRMPSVSNWASIYTNNTDHFMVGWVTLQASGSSGNWQFLLGGGNYNQTVPLTDGVPVYLPIAIPPQTTLNYISAPFVNGWATLFELKLA